MSLYDAVTTIKSVFEKDIFVPASAEEVAKRREHLVSDDDVVKLEEQILEIARDEADAIYKQLEKQYDYILSDEGISDELINNEREFTVDPETGRLDEAKKDVFKPASQEDVEARKAVARAARIKTGTVYFEDLVPEDKETIIQKYRDDGDYPGYDWWEGDIGRKWVGRDGKHHESRGYFDEELEKKGFEETEIHFSGFYSQGDGACFSCRLNVAQIIKHYKIPVRPIVLQEAEAGMFYGKITTSGRYSHSHTMEINLNYEGDANERRVVEQEEDVFKPASQEELAGRIPQGYKSLNDVYPAGATEIWYWKSTSTDQEHGQEANFMMGYEWCAKKGCLPDPNDLEKTHVLLGTVNLGDKGLNHTYNMMQGEQWSPEGEARQLIRSKGLEHTSMSVGDIIKIGDRVMMVDNVGFIDLNSPQAEVSEAQEEHPIFRPADTAELATRPGWAQAQSDRERRQEEYEVRRRRIEQRHVTQPDSRSLIQQWISGSRNKGKAASLSVKGDVLFSYATPIAIRGDNGVVHMVDQRFSVTTSKQQSFVRRYADNYDMIPVPQFKQMLDATGVDYSYSRLREDIFKPASKKEMDTRQMEWMKALNKKGVKIDYTVKPQPNRLSSFWYEGDVATVTFTALDGEKRAISVEAHGDIRVTFVDSDISYRGWNAVEEAMDRGYTDEDLGDADYEEPQGEYHGKVTDWDNNNWFEFMYSSSKWDGFQDVMGDTYGSYDEALNVAVEIVMDDELWHDLTRGLIPESVNEKDIFKPASKREADKRLGADKDSVWVIYDRQGAGTHEEEFFSSPEAVRQHLISYHSVDWEDEDGDINVMSLPQVLDYGQWEIEKISRKDVPVDAEILNEAEDIFKPAGEEELKARGSYKYLPKSGAFEYKFLKHVDEPLPDDTTWKIVGMGNYVDYDTSEMYFYKDGDIDFNINYDAELVVPDNMELNDALTAERQAFSGSDEEWLVSKGWKVEYSGYTGNEDPAYFWTNKDFGYISFLAEKDEKVLGGAIIEFRGGEPQVYLGDLNDVISAMHQSDPQQDIADMFGYDHYENLVYDIKKYRGTLTPEDEKKNRRAERSPGQLNWTFGTKNGGAEYYAESKVNEQDIFAPASQEEMAQRRSEYTKKELERKKARHDALKAYYAGIPYTYEDIKKTNIYKMIMELEGVEDTTTQLQKDHRTMAFKLTWPNRQGVATQTGEDDRFDSVPYFVYANGYLRSASFGATRVIQKFEPARTLNAYSALLVELYHVIDRKIKKEQAKPPFPTRYQCRACTSGKYLHEYWPHNYGTKIGNAHLKDPRNAAELERLEGLAQRAGVKLEL